MNISLRAFLLQLLACYRYVISPFLGRACRFEPSCSVYASQAIARFGVLQGVWRAGRRLLKCHPFHPGGFDPVKE